MVHQSDDHLLSLLLLFWLIITFLKNCVYTRKLLHFLPHNSSPTQNVYPPQLKAQSYPDGKNAGLLESNRYMNERFLRRSSRLIQTFPRNDWKSDGQPSLTSSLG